VNRDESKAVMTGNMNRAQPGRNWGFQH